MNPFVASHLQVPLAPQVRGTFYILGETPPLTRGLAVAAESVARPPRRRSERPAAHHRRQTQSSGAKHHGR